MKIILWFVFVFLLDLGVASYLLYSCNYKFDAFTVGIGIILQIYAVLQINRVEWFLDFGGRYQGYFNIFIILISFSIFIDGFAWHTDLGKFTQYRYCVPKNVEVTKVMIKTLE